ncbi:MAG: N-acetyltransferase [Kordiimonadaceae bacterium]|nr:N-acetyltransferase [Kordiimonadaceae bacterium]MBO6569048.1 N-acetyltransferase [Kordiimonadaceae bacterium]MBO6964523.1 N-acetyltransferase [Kordiimonadaceae bacterium]
MFTFDNERVSDEQDINLLLDKVFGDNRLEKASYALRAGVDPVPALSTVVRVENRLAATIRFWPVMVKDLILGSSDEALLLGPLAVDPALQGSGVGSALVRQSLAKANAAGFERILLVGEADYYARFGFVPVLPSFITLPGGRDARRLLVRQSARVSSLPAVGRLQPVGHQTAQSAIASPKPAFAV